MTASTRYILIALLSLCPFLIAAQSNEPLHLYYDTDQYDATKHQQTLNELIKGLTADQSIVIIGHTDSVGTDAYNQQLGLKRADEIRTQLIEAGVRNPITIKSLGESDPVAENGTAAGRQQNRRVDILLSGEQKQIDVTENNIDIQKLIAPYLPKPIVKTIDPTKNNDVPLGTNGTVLHVPKYAFVDAEGKTITTPVELSYTLYANAADMLFSEIPMTIPVNGEQQRFNSAGMFELAGSANGKPIDIAENKKLNIDFALTAIPEEIDFFQLDENNKWKKIQDIEPEPFPVDPEIVALLITDDGIKAEAVIPDSTMEDFANRRFNKWVAQDDVDWKPQPVTKQTGSLIRGNDAGHQYPDIVAGLNVGDFGVYNCDQIYKVGTPVVVNFTYKDSKGKPIADMHIVSLIDLDYNGAFSFSPLGAVTMNKSGENVIALFTKSGEIYVADAQTVSNTLSKNETAKTLYMKNMSAEIKTTEDLAAFLGINSGE